MVAPPSRAAKNRPLEALLAISALILTLAVLARWMGGDRTPAEKGRGAASPYAAGRR